MNATLYVPPQMTYHRQRHIKPLHFVLLDCRFIMSLNIRSAGGVWEGGEKEGAVDSKRGGADETRGGVEWRRCA